MVTATLETVLWIGALASPRGCCLEGLLGELAVQMLRTWRPVATA